MMSLPPLLVAGLGLVIIGVIGMVTRRSFLHVLVSAQVAGIGPALVFALQKDRGHVAAALYLLVFALLSVAGAAVAVTVYRRRGTVNVDELRELRG